MSKLQKFGALKATLPVLALLAVGCSPKETVKEKLVETSVNLPSIAELNQGEIKLQVTPFTQITNSGTDQTALADKFENKFNDAFNKVGNSVNLLSAINSKPVIAVPAKTCVKLDVKTKVDGGWQPLKSADLANLKLGQKVSGDLVVTDTLEVVSQVDGIKLCAKQITSNLDNVVFYLENKDGTYSKSEEILFPKNDIVTGNVVQSEVEYELIVKDKEIPANGYVLNSYVTTAQSFDTIGNIETDLQYAVMNKDAYGKVIGREFTFAKPTAENLNVFVAASGDAAQKDGSYLEFSYKKDAETAEKVFKALLNAEGAFAKLVDADFKDANASDIDPQIIDITSNDNIIKVSKIELPAGASLKLLKLHLESNKVTNKDGKSETVTTVRDYVFKKYEEPVAPKTAASASGSAQAPTATNE